MQPPFDLNLLKTQQIRDSRTLHVEAEAARNFKKINACNRAQASRWKDRLSAWIAAKLQAANHSTG